MKERERADRLARAMEDLIQGRPIGDLDDEDLGELLKIAKVRLDAARSSAHASAQHEATVWEHVLARLERCQGNGNGEANSTADSPQSAGSSAAADDPEQFDVKELQDVISLRRQMAERAASLAQDHRAAVWQQVRARIQSRSQTRGLFSFRRRRHPEAETLAMAVDHLVLGEPIWEATDSKLEELIHLARVRRAMGQASTAASRHFQGRLWAHIRPRLLARLMGSRQASPRVFLYPGRAWPKLAAAGAAVALLLAAVGPIPATGLAQHPVTQFVRFVGEHVGVSETEAPPVLPSNSEVNEVIVQGTDVTAAEASELLGLPVRQPNVVPSGFRQVSSKYFTQGITAYEGGTFMLAYEASSPGSANPPTILIYQESAFAGSIAVQKASVQDFLLADGTPATYVEGTWRPGGSEMVVWGDDSAQTLIFDRDGVRTIIHYVDGPYRQPSQLLVIAENMAPVDTP